MKIIDTLSRITPPALTKVCYFPCYALTQQLLNTQYLQTWARNSFHFGNLAFLKSDIDFTFYADKKCSHGEIAEALDKHSSLKKVLPILGEINIYRQEDLIDFESILNPLELERDPILSNSLSFNNQKANSQQRFAFLVHMLLADSHNLIHSRQNRKQKWEFHLKQLGIEDSSPLFQLESLEEFLQILFKQALPDLNLQSEIQSLRLLMELNREDGDRVNQYYQSLENPEVFILLSPSLWVGSSIWANQWQRDLEILENMDETKQRLYLAQLEWEAWGVLIQFHQSPKLSQIIPHLNSLKMSLDALNKISKQERNQTKLAFNKVIKRICEWMEFIW